ncbi:excalibur calcium-binding domain-containing protein [Nocardioides bruguierae]|uniref:Excalibur calcium-binding domain-containing protein n=1 Tax=Nocardioides bruguierae TaxID=2945102 RepID=A0A9X2DBH4_9ACTN|nr:excalibur calcium-binding domain-containing protein [Nocardioides bruguierae]MCM0622872.1 excalibur calcium-binding domain-containing protein [Nocardioides bruguierae]
MARHFIGSAAVAALMVGSLTAVAAPAQAATDFANCDAMHKVYKYGVAKSKRQVRSGHYRPAVRLKVYRANTESDADKDGTACEVTA